MYQEAVGLLNFNTGAAIGFVLLIPAFIAFLIDLITNTHKSTTYVTHPFSIKDNKIRDTFSTIFIVVVSIFILLPIFSFILVSFARDYPTDISFTFDNVLRTFEMSAGTYLVNSLLLGIAVSVIGTILAYCAAYMTARMRGKFSMLLHLMCITTLAIPGIVLGLSYIIFFGKTPLYGTFLILILVNIVHFIASPYMLAYNSLLKINANLENVGLTLGVRRWSIFKDVIIPQTKDTILEMVSFFFVNCMVTISAVSFLAGVSNMPLALLVTNFDSQHLIECAAFVSLMILVTNVLCKTVIVFLKRYH